jgi:hypothetical protein
MGSICVNHHIDRGQVIAHTERDGYVNPYTQFGTRWSIVRVGVLDCVPEQRKYCIKVRIVQTKDLKEVIEVETGFGESNLWLEWIQ